MGFQIGATPDYYYILSRVPTFTKRLTDGSTRVTRDSIRRSLVQHMEKHSENPSVFLDELSHLIHDMHDYQALSKKISKGKFHLFIFMIN